MEEILEKTRSPLVKFLTTHNWATVKKPNQTRLPWNTGCLKGILISWFTRWRLKNISQIGSFPQVGVKIKKNETTT